MKLAVLYLFTHMLYSGDYLQVRSKYLNHDTGNCLLSIFDYGPVGFGESNQLTGEGFQYPKGINQTLYYGSLACGNSETYVVDAYYEHQMEDHDWLTVKPLGRHIPPEFGLQEYDCIYNDSGPTSPGPKGLECYQYSVADADTNCDDFVIIEYIYTNKGPEAIDSLYSAIFMDFDINNYTDNYGKTDPSLRTAYMQPSLPDENPTVGIVYLGSQPQSPLPVANLSVIDHGIYVYPYQGLPDRIQWRFMNGTYSQSQSNRQYDWSIVVSVGPFNLAPGDSQHVTFAIVGGLSNYHYLENCRHAIEQYDTMWPGVAEGLPLELNQGLRIGPNPTRGRLSVTFSLTQTAQITISLFDPAGRMIASLHNKKLSRGKHNLALSLPEWIPSGIYFLVLNTTEKNIARKIVLRR
ncbi:hypothetical protein DRP53_10415 [candidate division WOR-3 bacterium]|uniref:Secretion system C-terminal sorting domain-containing protein n=1 Tax=candidate division WOR-3 bacterium TaxID=2052148 RepID=A0A660SCU6_UNCW3|nr:MAG: hypothetical protein DRP53_10415 [candidate division WOR-3 bacterium]